MIKGAGGISSLWPKNIGTQIKSEMQKKHPFRHRSFDSWRSSLEDCSLLLQRAIKDIEKNIAAVIMNVTKTRDAWLLTQVENKTFSLRFF